MHVEKLLLPPLLKILQYKSIIRQRRLQPTRPLTWKKWSVNASHVTASRGCTRQSQPREAACHRARGNGRKAQTNAGSIQKDSWVNSGWNEEADSYLATKRRTPTFDKEASMKKGAFLCKENFEHALEPNISKIYCTRYNVFGKFCDPKNGCRKRHIPFHHFKAEEKKDQYCYVVDNTKSFFSVPTRRQGICLRMLLT